MKYSLTLFFVLFGSVIAGDPPTTQRAGETDPPQVNQILCQPWRDQHILTVLAFDESDGTDPGYRYLTWNHILVPRDSDATLKIVGSQSCYRHFPLGAIPFDQPAGGEYLTDEKELVLVQIEDGGAWYVGKPFSSLEDAQMVLIAFKSENLPVPKKPLHARISGSARKGTLHVALIGEHERYDFLWIEADRRWKRMPSTQPGGEPATTEPAPEVKTTVGFQKVFGEQSLVFDLMVEVAAATPDHGRTIAHRIILTRFGDSEVHQIGLFKSYDHGAIGDPIAALETRMAGSEKSQDLKLTVSDGKETVQFAWDVHKSWVLVDGQLVK